MRFFLFAFAVLILLSGSLWAQGTQVAQIAGTVKDSSGAAVPGAEIKVTQTSTGIARTVVSGDDGSFTIPNLPIGPYRLETAMQGFSTYVQEGIVLQVNSNPVINPVLRVGSITEQVMVEANAAMVETRNTGVGQVIDQDRVVELPLNGRNVTDLVALSGAATDAGGGLKSNKNYPSASSFSVAGAQGGQTLFLLDGLINMDSLTNVGLPMPFPDALQEFKVETSSLPANYGLAPGGVVNVVTKSGGNAFHGSAFEFIRNYRFNATNTFAAKGSDGKRLNDGLKRNQFGGALGGPIIKNKMFFFGGYQGSYESVAPASYISYIPTAAVLQGDFTAMASPACNGGNQVTLRAPFVNNKVDPALLNPVAMKFSTTYIPTSPDPCGKIVYPIPNSNHENQFVAKVDWQINEKHSAFVRYFFTDYDHPPFYEGSLLPMTQQGNVGLADRVQSLVLGHTFTISPTTVSVLRAGFARSAVIRYMPDGVPTATDLGSKVTANVKSYFNFNVGSYFGIITANANPGPWINNTWNASEELNTIRGKHQISAGALWVHTQLNARGTFQSNGVFGFNGQATGNTLADFMLGRLSSFLQSTGQIGYERVNMPSAFVADNIRVSSRLTANIGIRWDPYLAPYSAQKQLNYFDMDWYKAGLRSKVFTNAPAGSLFPGDSDTPEGSYFFNSWGKFAPRFGIVYDPRGNGQESIRAGYGIFYGANALWIGDAGRQPYMFIQNYPSPAGGLSDPYLDVPGGNPFPLPNPLPANVTFPVFGIGRGIMFDLHYQPTYMQQWNLSLQKQLAGDWMISATYLGNRSLHLVFSDNLNPAVYVPGNCKAGQYGLTKDGACSNTANTNYRRALYIENPSKALYYGNLGLNSGQANGNYHGLVLSAQHRFTKTYSIMANHTWAHCLGESEVAQGSGGSAQNWNDRHAENGNCGSTRRHAFNFSSVMKTPKFSSVWTQRILSNWQASTIFTASTGSFSTVSLGTNNALRDGGDRPNLVVDPVLDEPTAAKWFNTSAFVKAPVGELGNAGRGILVGPGSWNIDLSLSRSFPFKEAQKIDFRAEIFNLLNHVRLNNPTTAMNSPQFGQINSSRDPRIMQFALKYTF